jgi:hypothetical protein
MDAYRRLRRDGLQPQRIDGSRELEHSGQSVFEIQTGLRGVPESKIQESYDLARESGAI